MATKEEVRRVSIFINGSEADMTLKQLQSGSTKLRNELARLVPGTEAFKQKMLELRQVNGVLQDIRNEINGVNGAFGWLKTEVGKLGALATGFLGLQFITEQFKNVISGNAKLADSISDIQKTTGMSEMAVKRLQASFKTINTRSSTSELNNLAEVAGKLGISGEKDVLGFVRAADQINVALGKDLGNAEQAINDLGKLTEIFHIKDDFGLEQALLKTGSAINGLGAAGTANEGYIVEFTKRLGGIAPQAKISIQDVMALGATMDELGQPVEAAATAIGQFVVGLGGDTSKFAKIAGMTREAFENLLSKDGTAALKAVLTNLKSSEEGVKGLAESMGMAGEEGARATAALGLLSNNLELFNKRQQQSSKLFQEGTSLTQEYNIKNNNMAATLDKLSKKFSALTANNTLKEFFTSVIIGASSFIDWLNRSMATIATLIKLVSTGGVAWLTYSTYVALANSTQLAFIVNLVKGESVMALSRTAAIALAGAKALLSGNITKATQAARLLNVTLDANPIGAVVAAIMAAVTAFMIFGDEVSDSVKIQNSLNDIQGEAEKSILQEKRAVEDSLKVLKNRNATKQQEAIAIAKLRELMPDHLQGYTDEEIKAGKATEAIKKYVDQLRSQARAKAAMNKITKLDEENNDLEIKKKQGFDNLSAWDKMKNGLAATFTTGALTHGSVQKAYNDKLQAQINANNTQIDQIQEMFAADLEKPDKLNLNTDTGSGGNGGFNLKTATKDELDQQLKKDTQQLAQLTRGTAEYNKVAAEMVAIRKRLKEINKDTGIGGGGEAPAKKAARDFKTLQSQVKALGGKALEDSMNKNQKEIKDAEDKYKTLIAKEKAFLTQKGVTAAQRATTEANITKLEKDMATDVANIRVRQEKEALEKIEDLRRSLAGHYETEYEKEIARINDFYDDMEANAATEEQKEIARSNRKKDLADAQIRDEQRLQKEIQNIRDDGFDLTANRDEIELARINKKYDDQIKALREKFSKEKQATKEFQDAIDAINKNRDDELAIREKNKKAEIQKSFKEAIVATTRELSDAFFSISADNRRAETDAQIADLEKKKDRELSNKNLTEQQRQAIERKYEKQENDIKLKAWKADQKAKMQQAIINGALAVTMALSSAPPPFNFINAAAVGAATLIQVGVIAKQKPPQFEEGGYSAVDYKKPKGWVKSPTLFQNSSGGRPFIAGENYKSEYIISSEQLKDPVISNFVSMMEANRGVRRFEAGGYSNVDSPGANSSSIPIALAHPQEPVDLSPLLLELQKNREAMANMKIVLSTQLFHKKEDKITQIVTDANA